MAKKKKAKSKTKKTVKKAAKKKSVKKVKKSSKSTNRAQKKTSLSSVASAMKAVLPWRIPLPGEIFIGIVEDYFSHLSVLATTLQSPVSMGDKIHVRGHTTDVIQNIDSMQIERQEVQTAHEKDSIGIKIGQRVRKGDYIYRIQL